MHRSARSKKSDEKSDATIFHAECAVERAKSLTMQKVQVQVTNPKYIIEKKICEIIRFADAVWMHEERAFKQPLIRPFGRKYKFTD